MAIDNMQGKVTTTGMVDNMPKMTEGNVSPQLPIQESPIQKVKTNEPQQENITNFQGTKNLTDEDMDTLNAALSPSVKIALIKIFPDLKNNIDQIGTNEPNVIIPLSVAKRYAVSKYGGEDESDAVNNFMADMLSPEIQQASQMEPQETTVPPSQPTETVGLMTSPQNMEQV